MTAKLAALDDDALVDHLQRAAFGYFVRHTNERNGLTADNSSPGSPASIAGVGFCLSAAPVGVVRGWQSRDAALERCLAAARFFDEAQRSGDRLRSHHGFFYHFLDMQTGARAWNCELSFIDTAILLAGMLTVAAFFDGDAAAERELRDRVAAIAGRVDWPWILDRNGDMHLGWKPGRGFLADRWTGYSEALLMLALGMGSATHPLPGETCRRWLSSLTWRDGPAGRYVRAPPLFIHLFPQVWLDLRGKSTPDGAIDWFENTRRAIAAQRAYASVNPGGFAGYEADLWGMTACNGPARRVSVNGARLWVRGYAARGAPDGLDDGTLAPWAPLACLPFAPQEALRATRRILARFPEALDEHHCFVDAIHPGIRSRTDGVWSAQRSSALDQGLLVTSIENHRSGLVRGLFTRSAWSGVKRL